MGIIKAAKLVHEYIRRDEDGKVEEIRRAVDGVDLDVRVIVVGGLSGFQDRSDVVPVKGYFAYEIFDLSVGVSFFLDFFFLKFLIHINFIF